MTKYDAVHAQRLVTCIKQLASVHFAGALIR
jgi:hypothetical protein